MCCVWAARNGMFRQKAILCCACCMCNPELLNKMQCVVANVHFPDYIIGWKWSWSTLTGEGEQRWRQQVEGRYQRQQIVYLLVYRTTNTLICHYCKKLYPAYAAWLRYCCIQLPSHSCCFCKYLCGCVENWTGKVNRFPEINLVEVEEMWTWRGFLVRFVAQTLVPARLGNVCGQE